MPSPHATSDVARSRYAGALQSALTLDEVAEAFLKAADGMIPANGVGLYRLNADGTRVVDVRASVADDFLNQYEQYGRADDPVLDFVVRQRRPIDSSRVTTLCEWDGCGARSALAVGGYYHSLEAPVIVAGELFGTINFARTPGLPPFDVADLVGARFASEQLGLAMERALRFELTGQRVSMLEHTLQRMPQPVIVTDLAARVLYRNKAADLPQLQEGIAEAMDAFRLHGKRVHTGTHRDEATGRRVIMRSFRLPESHDAAVTVVFTSEDQQSKRLPSWKALSRREQEIAELVAEGLTTKQIAERAFISEHTVKQHIKRMFAKTDVHNRAELVQLIWAAGGTERLP